MQFFPCPTGNGTASRVCISDLDTLALEIGKKTVAVLKRPRKFYCTVSIECLLVDCCLYRDLGDGLWEMRCTLVIEAKLLQDHPLPYKYVVFSPKMEKVDDCYEFLHSYASANPNRSLVLRKAKCKTKDGPGKCHLIHHSDCQQYHTIDSQVHFQYQRHIISVAVLGGPTVWPLACAIRPQ